MSKEDLKGGEEKTLPNDKINLDNQIDILRAIVVFWRRSKRAVSYREIAPLVGLTPPSVSRCLKFWKNTGLIRETSRGSYQPSDDLVTFNFDASNDINLPSIIGETWFGSVVLMSLSLKETMNEKEIKETIAVEHSVRNKDKPSDRALSYALELLLKSGVVERTNGAFRACQVQSKAKSQKSSHTIQIDDDKDFVQITIGHERFAVDRKELVAFVKQKGRSLGDEVKVE
ncbi:MAG: hypothetical protein ACFFER_07775 [Candidatus Thorarchaeota archaeon]